MSQKSIFGYKIQGTEVEYELPLDLTGSLGLAQYQATILTYFKLRTYIESLDFKIPTSS
ncbi:hypothetical protein GCM10007103_25180 [Salinimicrobium marinum]|uniref:Uncharacterized protein n=1 Tax=Salinimicrobium marinum TaxID=680283 RepID=A0A918SH09_9FLAO|nr:hypothetical protein GCM10007103_25180 [Salinimicrobium marinum]